MSKLIEIIKDHLDAHICVVHVHIVRDDDLAISDLPIQNYNLSYVLFSGAHSFIYTIIFG